MRTGKEGTKQAKSKDPTTERAMKATTKRNSLRSKQSKNEGRRVSSERSGVGTRGFSKRGEKGGGCSVDMD